MAVHFAPLYHSTASMGARCSSSSSAAAGVDGEVAATAARWKPSVSVFYDDDARVLLWNTLRKSPNFRLLPEGNSFSFRWNKQQQPPPLSLLTPPRFTNTATIGYSPLTQLADENLVFFQEEVLKRLDGLCRANLAQVCRSFRAHVTMYKQEVLGVPSELVQHLAESRNELNDLASLYPAASGKFLVLRLRVVKERGHSRCNLYCCYCHTCYAKDTTSCCIYGANPCIAYNELLETLL